MRAIIRATTASFAAALLPLALLAAPAGAQATPTSNPPARSAAEKIADASSAAPAAVSQRATIKDWPAKEGAEPTVLRKGDNGWVCYPSPPATILRPDPMCIDATWESWLTAYLTKGTPRLAKPGISYMLASNSEGSNSDPYASGATATNHWHKYGPHMMLVYPDAAMYEGISTDPDNGGPYVMWKGTPYAHIMVPVK